MGGNSGFAGHWQGVFHSGEFEIEVCGNWVEARAEALEDVNGQRQSAEAMVTNLIRVIGLKEKTVYRARLGSISRFDSNLNTRDVPVFPEGATARVSGGHAELRLLGPNGEVLIDSREQRLQDALQLAQTAGSNPILRRMIDFRLSYHGDADRKLASLLDIIELAETAFGHEHKAAEQLGIDLKEMQAARKITHDKHILTGRHPGRTVGVQRSPTPEELNLCERIVDTIIANYAHDMGPRQTLRHPK